MKKHDLTKLALMGLAGGLLFSGQAHADQNHDQIDVSSLLAKAHGCGANGCGGQNGNGNGNGMNGNGHGSCGNKNGNGMNGNGHGSCGNKNGNGMNGNGYENGQNKEMTHAQLWNKLSNKGRLSYQHLDDKHRQIALEIANNSCGGGHMDQEKKAEDAVDQAKEHMENERNQMNDQNHMDSQNHYNSYERGNKR